MVASGGDSGEVILSPFGSSGLPTKLRRYGSATRPVSALRYSPFKSTHLAAVYDDGALVVWDTLLGAQHVMFDGAHSGPSTAVGFSPLNRLLMCTAGLDRRLVFYDVDDKK